MAAKSLAEGSQGGGTARHAPLSTVAIKPLVGGDLRIFTATQPRPGSMYFAGVSIIGPGATGLAKPLLWPSGRESTW